VLQSASAGRTAPMELRGTRGSGHGLPINRDDDDEDGELVSDGIVTWRRKLPDLSEFGRASSTVDHHHHHHHQRHVTKQVPDARKMSTPAAADWSTHAPVAGRRDRREAFAQQKSFSYEAGCVGRRLPPTPDELAAAARARRDGSARGGGVTSTLAAYPVDRRRRMLMEAKKSYSLDDQIAPSHVAASEVATSMYRATQPYDPPPPRDAARLQVGRDTGRPAGREPAVSGERSPSGSGAHRKLLMLHSMRAMQHDNYETTTTTSDPAPPPPQSDIHATRTGTFADNKISAAATATAVHIVPSSKSATEPPPRVPPRTSRVDRLPIARIWSRLKFDRRAVTASGKK